jgi:superfamily II DNA or RNA helicase
MQKKKINILRDEGSMVISPPEEMVKMFLTLSHREMVRMGRKMVSRDLMTPMFREITDDTGMPVIVAYQGLWQALAEYLTKLDFDVTIKDTRPNILGYPALPASMTGLRTFQRPLIMEALSKGDSGLIGAPTRFGKSWLMSAICRAYPKAKTVVVAPGVDLCRQLHEHFLQVFPQSAIGTPLVKGVYTGSKNKQQSPDITICSVDSLEYMDHDDTDLMLVDEPHAVVSTARLPRLAKFSRARKYGLGATRKGRFDRKDRLIEAVIGPVLAEVTYKEAVAMGAISPLKVAFIKIPFSKDTLPGNNLDRAEVYARLLTQSRRAAKLVRSILWEAIPDDWQTIAFIQTERQALFYMEHAVLPEGKTKTAEMTNAEMLAKAEELGVIAMAKRMTAKERKRITSCIASGAIRRVLASNIYVQGVTFPDLKVVINLAGGGANTTAIQKPGRVLQAMPGKRYGVLIDIMLECRDAGLETRRNPPYAGVVGECWARHKTYTEIGYDVMFVESKAELKELIENAHE